MASLRSGGLGELFREGNPLDGYGAACHWAEVTRRINQKHYARWLGWLNATGALDPEFSPGGRASPESVRAYAQMLMETLAPRAAASAIIGLKCVLLRMHPDQDWRWLRDLTNRFKVWAGHTAPRTRKILPANHVFEGALPNWSASPHPHRCPSVIGCTIATR